MPILHFQMLKPLIKLLPNPIKSLTQLYLSLQIIILHDIAISKLSRSHNHTNYEQE